VSFEQALGAGYQAGAPLGAPARTAGMTGLGAALPAHSVRNEELAERLGVEPAWIEQRTGIRARRYAAAGEGVSALAVRAGEAALREAGIAACELDLVLVATLAADDITAAAPIVAHELGATRAAAIDVGAACSGTIAALALATGWIEAGHAEHALVIGAEVLSRFIDAGDRGTAPLFGDGAGAIALSGEAAGRIGPFVLGSDGSARESIRVTRERGVIEMEGHDTFLRAVYRLATATREVLAREGLGVDDIDLFVYHQANGRILTAVAERLGVPGERVFDCIGELGNTSAASVPLALDAAARSGALQPGSRVLLGAVGAGLTWGAALACWEPS
jgi:3-oxoacyl-[acyl-carrier-protein] synthase-3